MAAANHAADELIPDLAEEVKSRAAGGAAAKLEHFGGAEISRALSRLSPGFAMDILDALPADARDPFALPANLPMMDAMKLVLDRHYPVYPVVDADKRLVGLVRGQSMFEAHAIEISLQAGSMVGLEKEERVATPPARSLRMRHPWLQLNLLTAFLAAAVVGFFQDTIDRLVILALFLPVLAGQSGNTGCQALAVTLRGMTLGELKPGGARELVSKEAWLGAMNGAGVGLMAGLGMYITATGQHLQQAGTPPGVVLLP